MAKRCRGTTRAGKPCSIAADCQLTNDSGRLVGEPLQRGGDYCLYHAKPFCTQPADAADASAIVILLDLETTGVSVGCDRIVELAVP